MRRFLAVLMVAVLAACGGGDGGGDGGESNGPPPTIAPSPEGEEAGRVIEVIDSLTEVDGRRAGGGDPLFAGSRLATDARGRATFSVGEVLPDCQMQTRTSLTVAPAGRTPFDLAEGSLICRSKPGTDEFQVDAGDAVVQFLDPIFRIETAGASAEVQVDHGFVQVRAAGGEATRLIGPGSGMTVSEGSLPDRAEPFEFSALDRFDTAARQRMRADLPPDPSGLPAAGDSPALERIAEAGALEIEFDASGGRPVAGFVSGLFGAVGEAWEVDADASADAAAEAVEAMADGDLDAYVSFRPLAGLVSTPLFDDEGENDWFLSVVPDARYQDALADVLTTLLDNGAYAEAYRAAFGRLPTYEAVRGLAYPVEGPEVVWVRPAVAEVAELVLAIDPAEYQGECPAELELRGRATIRRPGVLEYQFVSGDGEVIRGAREFSRAGTFDLPPQTVEVEDDSTGTWQLRAPTSRVPSAQADYEVACLQPVP